MARAHQHAFDITRHTGAGSENRNPGIEPPDHATGRSRGGLSIKINQLKDGNGLPLVVLLAPAKPGGAQMFEPLMGDPPIAGSVGQPRTRPKAALVVDGLRHSTHDCIGCHVIERN